MKRYLSKSRILSVLVAASLLFTIAAPAQLAAKNLSANAKQKQSIQKQNRKALHIKLKDGSGVFLSDGTFVGGNNDQTAQLNSILSGAKRVKAEKLVDNRSPRSDLEAKLQDSLKNYFKVTFAQDIDVESVVSKLKVLSIVETAYAEAKPAPSPSANYSGLQTYTMPSPKGINSGFADTFPGATGNKVNLIDIEYSWNVNHEDLSKVRKSIIPNRTPVDPLNDTNHGTAVLGELIADKNSIGVTGAVPGINAVGLINTYTAEKGYDILNALAIATYLTRPGDVILIEQQTWGPSDNPYGYVPMEWIPEVYDSIKVLTSGGRIVVEAGGNGKQNLDDASYYGTSFPMGKPDSGAIIVGAGNNCAGAALRSRWVGSNYGKRINLQGPADCVVSTGYGDLGGSAANSYYTENFGSTSGASAVVAAAAVALSSAYKTLNNNATLTPMQIRDILIQTGTKQNTTGLGVLAGNIGPLPNLATALLKADTKPPTVSTGLTVKLNTSKQPVLSWVAPTDNVKVALYGIYRNDVPYSLSASPSFTDTAVNKNTTYRYKVVSADTSSNLSPMSSTVSITTPK